MRIVVLSITFRTFENIRPVLDRLRSKGSEIEVVWCPTSVQLPGQGPACFGFPPTIELGDGSSGEIDSCDAAWLKVAHFLASFKPQLIISDDCTNWPNRNLFKLVSEGSQRCPYVSFQHGLHQPWHAIASSFHCDYFFCYGTQHVFNFPYELWHRIVPAGLPKLDNLRGTLARDEKYILYFAQSAPKPAIVGELLMDVSETLRLPVKIRPHPAHMQLYRELSSHFEICDTRDDPLPVIANSSVFMSTHSTSALEALILNKNVVLLPSFGLVDFGLYPYVAQDFTGRKVEVALGRMRRSRAAIEFYLERTCGGRRFDSTERCVHALNGIVAMAHASQNEWWNSDNDLRRAVEEHHPLCALTSANK